MKRIVLLGSLLAGCATKSPPPPEPAREPTAPTSDRTPDGLKATATKLRERACACADAACGKSVSDDLAAWQASVGSPMSSDPAVEQSLEATLSDIKGCLLHMSDAKETP